MKYIFIIALLAAVAIFIYWRLRPYLKVMRNVLGFMRDVRRMSAGGRPVEPPPRRAGAAPAAAERLVRCSSCGTWLPASRAVSLRASKNFYCSHACLERSVEDEAEAKTGRR